MMKLPKTEDDDILDNIILSWETLVEIQNCSGVSQ
jgi:hypothetical protein